MLQHCPRGSASIHSKPHPQKVRNNPISFQGSALECLPRGSASIHSKPHPQKVRNNPISFQGSRRWHRCFLGVPVRLNLTVVLALGFAALGAEIPHAYRPRRITHANTPTDCVPRVRRKSIISTLEPYSQQSKIHRQKEYKKGEPPRDDSPIDLEKSPVTDRAFPKVFYRLSAPILLLFCSD